MSRNVDDGDSWPHDPSVEHVCVAVNYDFERWSGNTAGTHAWLAGFEKECPVLILTFR